MAKLERDTRRVCIRLWDEDCVELERMTSVDMNFNELVRRAIHEFVLHAKDRMRKHLDNAQSTAQSTATAPKDW